MGFKRDKEFARKQLKCFHVSVPLLSLTSSYGEEWIIDE